MPWCPPPSDTETRATQCLLALGNVTTQPTEAFPTHWKTPLGARQEPWRRKQREQHCKAVTLELKPTREGKTLSSVPKQDDYNQDRILELDPELLELDPELPRCSECSRISQSYPNQESHVLNKETLNLQVRQRGAQRHQ